jgi:hypothetical protein
MTAAASVGTLASGIVYESLPGHWILAFHAGMTGGGADVRAGLIVVPPLAELVDPGVCGP